MPDTIGGLPLHPLIVHFAVTLLPLSALALLVLIAVPRWRKTFGWVVLAGLFVSVGTAWVAKETGEGLASVLGLPQEHAQWGDRIVPIAGLLFIAAAVWFWQVRKGATGALTTISAIVSAILAVISIIVIVIVGHTGAQAAWAGKMAAATAPAPAATAAGSSGSSSSSGSATGAITMADVQQHASSSDCWSVVNGTVYNLTDWIAQHPGGQSPIEQMCGQDATSAFDAQHGGQRTPEKVLAGFEIGTLS